MIYYKLSEYEQELLEYLSNHTGVNYGIVGDMFPMKSFIALLRDLKIEIDLRDEKIENYKENYRPLTKEEIYIGYHEK